jgi:hypothetical protein
VKTRRACVRLFGHGLRAADIAGALELASSTVAYHLRRAGLDPAARKAELAAATRERFAAAWNAAPDLESLCAALGLAVAVAEARASRLRAAGVALKRMAHRWPRSGSKAAEVIRLHRQGTPPEMIARRVGAPPEQVHAVLRRLKAEGRAV